MGFSRGNLVFDPVAETVISYLKIFLLSEDKARELLSTLISSLQAEIDWDTESESLEEYSHIGYVVSAFEQNDVHLELEDEDEDEDEDEEPTVVTESKAT